MGSVYVASRNFSTILTFQLNRIGSIMSDVKARSGAQWGKFALRINNVNLPSVFTVAAAMLWLYNVQRKRHK